MSQDWNPGGAPPPGQSPGMPVWPGTTSTQVASVPARWPLAITSLFFFLPLGIAACVYAAKVVPALQVGDVTTALNASNRVKVFFWISLAVLVLSVIASAGSSGSG